MRWRPRSRRAIRGGDDLVGKAFDHLYRFQFAEAHRTLNAAEEFAGNDPLTHIARASTYLFFELDRLGILASEFFQDQGERLKRKELTPDAEVRAKLDASLERARVLALGRADRDAGDADALFALAMADGVHSNYLVFVEKKRLGVLPFAKRSHEFALDLLARHPGYDDARVVTGVNEYMVAGLPFFIRWFVRFREVEGDKEKAVSELQRVTRSGRYLKPFAAILLAAIYLREKRWTEGREILAGLRERYPENRLFGRELARLEERMAGAAN